MRFFYVLMILLLTSCKSQTRETKISYKMENKIEKAVLAGGCFWCLEAAFDQLKGVIKVQSGFSGGHTQNPTYRQVCDGNTGHAEVVEISYNPQEISYATLLEVFWVIHDPTQLNRQGNDVGTQYRSAIFYMNDEQKKIAEKSIQISKNRGDYSGEYVTELVPFKQFSPADSYHTDYYENNGTQPYCSAVIAPKMRKFQKKFHSLLKKE